MYLTDFGVKWDGGDEMQTTQSKERAPWADWLGWLFLLRLVAWKVRSFFPRGQAHDDRMIDGREVTNGSWWLHAGLRRNDAHSGC